MAGVCFRWLLAGLVSVAAVLVEVGWRGACRCSGRVRKIRNRLAAFEIRYNALAIPFNWKFTRTDLDDPLHRLDAHDNTHPWQHEQPPTN